MIDRYYSPVRDNAMWKSKNPESDSSDDEELDLSQEIHPISYYIDDREEMIEQIFSSIKSRRFHRMLAPCLKDVPTEELKADCLIHLLGMSKKRILSIIEGGDLHSSTDTESDSVDAIDNSGSNDVSKTDLPNDSTAKIRKSDSQENSKNDKSNLQSKSKGSKNNMAEKWRRVKNNMSDKTKAVSGDECELDITVSEKDVNDLMQFNKTDELSKSKKVVDEDVAVKSSSSRLPVRSKSSKEKSDKIATKDNDGKSQKTIGPKTTSKENRNDAVGGIANVELVTKKCKADVVNSSIHPGKQTSTKSEIVTKSKKKSVDKNEDGKKKKTKNEPQKEKQKQKQTEQCRTTAASNEKKKENTNNTNDEGDKEKVDEQVVAAGKPERNEPEEDKGSNLLEIMELEMKADAIRALLQNHDDEDLDVKVELLGLTDLVKLPECSSPPDKKLAASQNTVDDNVDNTAVGADVGTAGANDGVSNAGSLSKKKDKDKKSKDKDKKSKDKKKKKKPKDKKPTKLKESKKERSKNKKKVRINERGQCGDVDGNAVGAKLNINAFDIRNVASVLKIPGCQDISPERFESDDNNSSSMEITSNELRNSNSNHNNSKAGKRKTEPNDDDAEGMSTATGADCWPQRWLESKNVKDVVTTSKICANIRKRMKLARMTKQQAAAAASQEGNSDLNLDITGSVGEYYRLVQNNNETVNKKPDDHALITSSPRSQSTFESEENSEKSNLLNVTESASV